MSSTKTSRHHYLVCGLCQIPNMPHEDPNSIMCLQCRKHTTPEQQDKYWDITCGDSHLNTETNYLVQFFSDVKHLDSPLPDLAMLNIFLMLTTVCRSATEFIPVCLNFLKAMSSVISQRVFIAHLEHNAPNHHKMLHDWLMFLKYYPYFRQTIPECLGPVCYVSPADNPQIAKIYLVGDANSFSSTYLQDTTIGHCACRYKTSCETEEDCIRHSLPSDGNCNIFEVNSEIVSCAFKFVMASQREFEWRFIRELRYMVWLQAGNSLDSEPATNHIKPDTRRITRTTDRMRHQKTKQKNSRRPRPDKNHLPKGGNFGKNKHKLKSFAC